jgi:hypothetical protein
MSFGRFSTGPQSQDYQHFLLLMEFYAPGIGRYICRTWPRSISLSGTFCWHYASCQSGRLMSIHSRGMGPAGSGKYSQDLLLIPPSPLHSN